MSSVTQNELQEKKNRVLRDLVATEAAITIADMDPHTLEDLMEYIAALAEAHSERDDDRMAYIREAIEELLKIDCNDGDKSIEEWENDLIDDPAAEAAVGASRIADSEFVVRYQEAKLKAGIATQRDVADKCGISINTVNAIETQRVRPQSRTIQSIAKGLGVSVSWLLQGSTTT